MKAQDKKRQLRPGFLPHLLLSVASLTPTTTIDLMNRVDERYGVQDCAREAPVVALKLLVAQGYLMIVGPTGRGYRHEHVLTPAGEEELDRLWDEQHARGAA